MLAVCDFVILIVKITSFILNVLVKGFEDQWAKSRSTTCRTTRPKTTVLQRQLEQKAQLGAAAFRITIP